MADTCPVCRKPLPSGRDMTWPAVIGTFFGFWRGYAWMPGGFAHRHCLAVAARRLQGKTAARGYGHVHQAERERRLRGCDG